MKYKLKNLKDQVIVITGASSGIGLCTARMAARQGAKVVVSGRSESALRHIEQELNAEGCQALAVPADVAREEDLRFLAEEARRRFGHVDTWVNNAGLGIYGRILDVPLEDQRRMFDTNFWGVVYGSRVAVESLRQNGGALINMGSVTSDRATPLQGIYSASKAAIKSYTDALRMELEEASIPIAVTLIQPTSIDTPFPQHARNHLASEPRLPDPVYAPEIVARAILHAAQSPTRHLLVGGAAKAMSVMGRFAPRLTDKYMERSMFDQQQRDTLVDGRHDILYSASEDPRERGAHDGRVMEWSAYTEASKHPVATAALAIGAGVAVATLISRRRAGNGKLEYQPEEYSLNRDSTRAESGRYRQDLYPDA